MRMRELFGARSVVSPHHRRIQSRGDFGFTESLRAPFVIESIALELAGAASLATWVGLDLLQRIRVPQRRLQGQRDPHGADDNRISSFIRHPQPNIQS
jgi:hypothetical protein